MKKVKKFRTIDSILQLTKDVVHKNDKYYDYIIDENNSLYNKQLPLLMKNSRMKSMILLDSQIKEKEIIYQSTKNSSQKDEKKSEINYKPKKIFSHINNIRAIKIRSKKLPPLCPLYDDRGTLLRSLINPKREFSKDIINNLDIMHNYQKSIEIKRNSTKIINYQKLKIKKISYNKSFNSKITLNNQSFKIKNLNEATYNNLIYDESKIYGNRNLYQDIIKNKLIELQTVYNQNFTIKKEKIYKYGQRKKKIYLTLDSLKIRLNEVKDELSYNIEVYEKPSFEYTFPFALLPLFYYKNIDTFLIVLTKILIWDEENQSFSMPQNVDEIISDILKNCDDFCLGDNDIKSLFEEKEGSEIDLNIVDLIREKRKTSRSKSNKTINSSDVNKFNSSITSFFKESSNNLDLKNNNYRKYDIYPKLMKVEEINISTYEFFWLTPKKSFILTIEKPLITVNIPSNKILAKKYIDYDLLFYLYSKKFVLWDFYIINNLLSYRNFRNVLDNLYSIPEKRDLFFYIIQPKHRKNLFTFYELTSLITREGKNKKNKGDNSIENKIDNNQINNINNKENEKEKEGIYLKLGDNNNKNEENKNDTNINTNNESILKNKQNKSENNNITYFNSTITQKGLLAVVYFIDIENNIYNQYTFHFNLDQLRKFQIMENFVDKLSFFIKFLNVDCERKIISFDFDSFNEFNELNWIKDFNKYNINFLNQNNTNNSSIPNLVGEFPGLKEGIKIKVEIKYPLIQMRALNNSGFNITESVNVDHRVEQLLKKMIIHNSIDLTRQLFNILRDNNFCRKIYVSKRAANKMGTKKKRITNKKIEIPMNQIKDNSSKLSRGSLDVVPDANED